MKNAKLTSMLIPITAISAVASILLVAGVFLYARQLRGLQSQVAFINQTRPMINALAQELVIYSEKNPSIDPILLSTGVKQPRNPAPVKPAAK
jgi:hypothetical protein